MATAAHSSNDSTEPNGTVPPTETTEEQFKRVDRSHLKAQLFLWFPFILGTLFFITAQLGLLLNKNIFLSLVWLLPIAALLIGIKRGSPLQAVGALVLTMLLLVVSLFPFPLLSWLWVMGNDNYGSPGWWDIIGYPFYICMLGLAAVSYKKLLQTNSLWALLQALLITIGLLLPMGQSFITNAGM